MDGSRKSFGPFGEGLLAGGGSQGQVHMTLGNDTFYVKTFKDEAAYRREKEMYRRLEDVRGVLQVRRSIDADRQLFFPDEEGGGPLAHALELRTLCPGLAAEVMLFGKVAGALSRVHAENVVHGDVTPNNILVNYLLFGIFTGTDPIGNKLTYHDVLTEGNVWLCDFGLSAVGGDIGLRGVGTVGYMAPEVASLRSPPTFASDCYGLGMVAYDIFAGRDPWGTPVGKEEKNGAHERRLADFNRPPPALNSPSEELNGLVSRLVRPHPSSRASLVEVIDFCVDFLNAKKRLSKDDLRKNV